MRIPSKFKFPNYESVNWFASQKLIAQSKSILSGSPKPLPNYLSNGLKHLMKALKSWTQEPPPLDINSHRTLRDLNKVLKQSDKRKKSSTDPVIKIKLPEQEPSGSQLGDQNNTLDPPIKLMIPKPVANYNSNNQNVNLTDRDSVRQLMLAQRKKSMAELDMELGSALMSFGDDDQGSNMDQGGDSLLQIDFSLAANKKKSKSLKDIR